MKSSSARLRIRHWSSHVRGGGAGLAAVRLHQALLGKGLDSRIFSLESGDAVDVLPSDGPRLQELVQAEIISPGRPPRFNTRFSLPAGGTTNHEACEADGIHHLHWINDLLDLRQLGLLFSRKPAVWTLHDQWPLTGGCHYRVSCEENENECAACPQLHEKNARWAHLLWKAKRQLFDGQTPTIICPSAWMANEARRSSLLRDANIVVAPNTIDTDAFAPLPASEARAALSLPQKGRILLFAADQHGEHRKGLDLLMAALPELSRRVPNLLCITLGGDARQTTDHGCPMIGFGRLSGHEQIRLLYQACDLVVVPSREDNLPNILLEAGACGRPSVGFTVGGIPEIIDNDITGLLAGKPDTKNLVSAILHALVDDARLQQWGAAARENATRRYAFASVAARHQEIYTTLAAPHPRRARQPNIDWRDADLASTAWDLREQRLREQLSASETDRASRLVVITKLDAELNDIRQDHAQRGELIEKLSASLREEKQGRERLEGEVRALRSLVASLNQEMRPLLDRLDCAVQEKTLHVEQRRKTDDDLRHAQESLRLLRLQLSDIETDRGKRLDIIIRQANELEDLRRDHEQRGNLIQRISAELAESEKDRALRLDAIQRQADQLAKKNDELDELRNGHEQRGALIEKLAADLARSENDRESRLDTILRQSAEFDELRRDHEQRGNLIQRISAELAESEKDRALRLDVIQSQDGQLRELRADHGNRGDLIRKISAELQVCETDRQARLGVIERISADLLSESTLRASHEAEMSRLHEDLQRTQGLLAEHALLVQRRENAISALNERLREQSHTVVSLREEQRHLQMQLETSGNEIANMRIAISALKRRLLCALSGARGLEATLSHPAAYLHAIRRRRAELFLDHDGQPAPMSTNNNEGTRT